MLLAMFSTNITKHTKVFMECALRIFFNVRSAMESRFQNSRDQRKS